MIVKRPPYDGRSLFSVWIRLTVLTAAFFFSAAIATLALAITLAAFLLAVAIAALTLAVLLSPFLLAVAVAATAFFALAGHGVGRAARRTLTEAASAAALATAGALASLAGAGGAGATAAHAFAAACPVLIGHDLLPSTTPQLLAKKTRNSLNWLQVLPFT
jgi:hypothetical protein